VVGLRTNSLDQLTAGLIEGKYRDAVLTRAVNLLSLEVAGAVRTVGEIEILAVRLKVNRSEVLGGGSVLPRPFVGR
jgi:hypothetical protein